ncbi:MAG: choice-of-anchor Q domain-containing protein [Paludibacteraceae bacterium]|nr:choice-of-anchor Q domain-containing protein [Paludibacteraceae bacterium]
MKKLILSIGLLLGAMSLNAGVVYVAPNAVGDSTGSSWDNAMENIQMAINKAKQDPTGTTDVWVKAGTYNIPVTIALKDSVSIYGSFAGTETSIEDRAMVEGGQPWEFANPTIINGGDSISCFNAPAKAYVQPMIVDGFIFENGNSQGGGYGGAVRMRPNMTLTRSILRNNHNAKAGGGAALVDAGYITYCLFENNSQRVNANGGGAIHANTVKNEETHIEHCVFRGNISAVRGGAINCQGQGKNYIDACIFYNNAFYNDSTLEKNRGGGALYDNAPNTTSITNCVFYNNTGWHLKLNKVSNALYIKPGKFINNTVVYNVGGVYIGAGNSTSEVCNNIVWANVTNASGDAATSLSGDNANNLLALNNYTYNPIPTNKGWKLSVDAEVANSNVQFASNKSNGDFEVAEGAEVPEGKCLVGPHFVKVPTFFGAIPADMAEADKEVSLAELEAADFHIKRQSALLNAGTDSAYVEADLDGNNRPQGPRGDVGAYELPYHSVVVPAYNAEEGTISNEKGLDLNDTTLYAVEGSSLRFYVMTSDAEVPYLVQTVASTNGGLTFDGAKTNVTDSIDAEELILDLTIVEPIKLEVVWTAPIVDYTVTLAVVAGCEEMGTVEGAGTYAAGTEITIKAVAKAGYRFVKWSDENTEAARKIVVTEDLNLTATFEQGEGLADAQANTLAITSEKDGVRVSGLQQGSTVEVFDLNGRQVFSTVAESESLFINLQQGMYIIRQGANRGKAIVK